MVPNTQPHYRPVFMDFSLLHWLVLNTLNDGIWCQDGPIPVGGGVRCGVCWFMCTTLSRLRLLKNNFLLIDLPVTLKQKFPDSLHRRFGISTLCLGDRDQL